MKLRLFISTILLVSINAFASETAGKYDWSGPYIGGQIGYASGTSRYRNEVDERIKFSPDGFPGGVYGGYNYQFGNNVVVGVDADFNGANIKGSGKYYDENGRDTSMHSSIKMRWNGAFRARAGYAIGRFLPYVAGGLSYGKYDFKVWDNVESLNNSSKTRTGWNIGVGFDYAVTDYLVARLDYRYSDFGKARILGDISDSVNFKTHDVRLGIAYKF